jgi:hypothetical protein
MKWQRRRGTSGRVGRADRSQRAKQMYGPPPPRGCHAPLEASAAMVRLRERGNSWSPGALSPTPECILRVGGGEGEDEEVLEELVLRLKAEESRRPLTVVLFLSTFGVDFRRIQHRAERVRRECRYRW